MYSRKKTSDSHIKFKQIIPLILLCCLMVSVAQAQTTEFTYQGRLNDNSTAANGNYDFEFRLFKDATGGAPLDTISRSGVPVINGIFTVQLDFGAQFTGAARFLEIAVEPTGGSGFTTLAPRQPVTSTPYAIRSAAATSADTAGNALQLGGVEANQYVLTSDPRLTNSRNPLPDSPLYIQNRTTQQPFTANFNISGSGTAGGTLSGNIVNAQTQYNIGGTRFLSVGTSIFNTFVGVNSGLANPTGGSNSFFGFNSGSSNDSGFANSFFGANSGLSNTSGSRNAFFGEQAGQNNTEGGDNAFFGDFAGRNNTTGIANAFFGQGAGAANMIGSGNVFIGHSAGQNNISGGNTFVGSSAGRTNTEGIANSFFGTSSGLLNETGNFNSFFGRNAGFGNRIGVQNSFFGFSAGENTISSNNAFFGDNAGQRNTTGSRNVFLGSAAGFINGTGSDNTIIGFNANVDLDNLSFAAAIGSGATVSTNNTIILGRSAGQDTVRVPGNLQLTNAGRGIVLKSPNGAVCRQLTIDNAGAIVLTPVTCP